MKKTVAIVLAVVLIISAALFAFGCTKDEEKPAETTTQGTATISGKISISGSTSVKPVVAALAEAFEEINGDAEIDIQEGGSSVGIADATEKKVDMGMSSRELKDTETGLNETVIAYDGIAVIVHKDVSVDDLNKEQLQQVFAGTIRDWSELGGDPGAIVVIGRDPASGTRGAFEELVKLDGKDPNPSAAYAQEKDSTGAVKATVQTTKNAIGYISLEAVDDTVKTVKVAGVEPSIDTVKDKTYVLFRPFLLVNSDSAKLSAASNAFVAFILSEDGQGIVRDNKLIPVN